MRYPTTMGILATCTLSLVASTLHPHILDLLCFTMYTPFGMSFGLLTYQFVHANTAHLMGNFIFGLPFMTYLERRLGSAEFLTFFLSCGIGSALVNLAVAGPSELIGASGSIMGCMVAAALLVGKTPIERGVGVMFFSLLLVTEMSSGVGGLISGSSVAHFGHVGGAITALILLALNNSRS